MKRLIGFLFVAVLASGCGNGTTATTDPKAAPIPTTSPAPAPTQTGTSKWSSQELSGQSQACAQAGDTTTYTQQNWLTFCTCTYTAAALKWNYNDFFANFQTNYTTLYNDGSVPACLRQAGMTQYLSR